MESLCTTHSLVVALKVRDIISLNDSFSNFLLAELFKLMVLLKICYSILEQVFYMTLIFLVFVLIPRYICFGVMYA